MADGSADPAGHSLAAMHFQAALRRAQQSGSATLRRTIRRVAVHAFRIHPEANQLQPGRAASVISLPVHPFPAGHDRTRGRRIGFPSWWLPGAILERLRCEAAMRMSPPGDLSKSVAPKHLAAQRPRAAAQLRRRATAWCSRTPRSRTARSRHHRLSLFSCEATVQEIRPSCPDAKAGTPLHVRRVDDVAVATQVSTARQLHVANHRNDRPSGHVLCEAAAGGLIMRLKTAVCLEGFAQCGEPALPGRRLHGGMFPRRSCHRHRAVQVRA